jgi:hypothetical protein
MNGDDVITLDTPAYIKSGRTYLPVRALGESLGAQYPGMMKPAR